MRPAFDEVSDTVSKVREKHSADDRWALVKIMEECLMRLEGYGVSVPKRFTLITWDEKKEESFVYPPSNDVEAICVNYDRWILERPNKPIALIDLGWCGSYRTVVKKHDPSIPV